MRSAACRAVMAPGACAVEGGHFDGGDGELFDLHGNATAGEVATDAIGLGGDDDDADAFDGLELFGDGVADVELIFGDGGAATKAEGFCRR